MVGTEEMAQRDEEQILLEERLHQLRRDIDVNIKAVDKYRCENYRCGRPAEIAYTNLQEAKMWIGKCLEAVGSPFPEKLRDESE